MIAAVPALKVPLAGTAAVMSGVRATERLWAGFFALFRGISEIVIAFGLRSRQHA
jgi:hypothetical protein